MSARLCGYWWFLWFRLDERRSADFPSSRLLYIYDNGGDRFDEVSRAKQRFSVGITLCLLLRGKSVILEITVFTYVAYGLRIVPFICLIVKADTSLFRARARSL